MLSNWKLAKDGWNNLKTIATDGWDGLKDVFTPSKEDVVQQVTDVTNPTPDWGETVTVVKEVIPDSVTKYGRYAKYALIGGAALIVLSFLKK